LDSLLEDLQQNPETSQEHPQETLKESSYERPNPYLAVPSHWKIPTTHRMEPTEKCMISTQDDVLGYYGDISIESSSLQNNDTEISQVLPQEASLEERVSVSKDVELKVPTESILASTVAIPISKSTAQDWWAVCNRAPIDSTPSSQIDISSNSSSLHVGSDQLRMYWIDAYEYLGTVYLFGKVRR
jgi:hypothetical protein